MNQQCLLRDQQWEWQPKRYSSATTCPKIAPQDCSNFTSYYDFLSVTLLVLCKISAFVSSKFWLVICGRLGQQPTESSMKSISGMH